MKKGTVKLCAGQHGILGSNPLRTEPSVVLKRYTSGALAFQGSCITICKLSNIFNKYALSDDLSSL